MNEEFTQAYLAHQANQLKSNFSHINRNISETGLNADTKVRDEVHGIHIAYTYDDETQRKLETIAHGIRDILPAMAFEGNSMHTSLSYIRTNTNNPQSVKDALEESFNYTKRNGLIPQNPIVPFLGAAFTPNGLIMCAPLEYRNYQFVQDLRKNCPFEDGEIKDTWSAHVTLARMLEDIPKRSPELVEAQEFLRMHNFDGPIQPLAIAISEYNFQYGPNQGVKKNNVLILRE